MDTYTTSAEASKSPLCRFEELFAANERQGILLETIDENLHHALNMGPGEIRDKELEQSWMLFWTAREIHARLHREMGDLVQAFFAERQPKGGTA
jgi:hypothetical protein